jgi:hypothetical protein
MELILNFDGYTYKLRDQRVVSMMCWIINRMDRVCKPERLRITFDCAGPSVSAEILERERAEPALR